MSDHQNRKPSKLVDEAQLDEALAELEALMGGPSGLELEDESEDFKGQLLQLGMQSLFEDQEFSGELMTQMFKLGLSEEEMDSIFKRAEDEILGFVGVLADAGAPAESSDALNGFICRLKAQILSNPAVYVEGS